MFSSVVSILPLVSSFSPLKRPFRAFRCYLFPSRVVFLVFAFDFFSSQTSLFLLPLPLLRFRSSLCGSFVCQVFLCQTALLLDSRSANANAECNNKCVCSQCSCHLVYSWPLLKGMRAHWGLIGFQGDCRQPLRGAIYTAGWINNVIMTWTSYLLLLSGGSQLHLFANGGRQ